MATRNILKNFRRPSQPAIIHEEIIKENEDEEPRQKDDPITNTLCIHTVYSVNVIVCMYTIYYTDIYKHVRVDMYHDVVMIDKYCFGF